MARQAYTPVAARCGIVLLPRRTLCRYTAVDRRTDGPVKRPAARWRALRSLHALHERLSDGRHRGPLPRRCAQMYCLSDHRINLRKWRLAMTLTCAMAWTTPTWSIYLPGAPTNSIDGSLARQFAASAMSAGCVILRLHWAMRCAVCCLPPCAMS